MYTKNRRQSLKGKKRKNTPLHYITPNEFGFIDCDKIGEKINKHRNLELQKISNEKSKKKRKRTK